VVGVVSLVVSLAAGLLVLERLGVTLNAIVVAGLVLAIAIAIDDALGGVDEILRRGRRPSAADAGQTAAWIIGEAVVARRRAILFALLVAIAAIVPLFFTLGVPGAFLPPLLGASILGVLVSAVVAVTLTPALAAVLMAGADRNGHQTRASRRLQDRYAAIVARLLDRSRPLFVAAGVVTVAVAIATAAFATSRPSDAFVPPMREGNVLVGLEGPPGASEAEMNRILARAAAEIRALPGVTNVGGHVGRAITSDQVSNVNSGELWVRVDPAADHARTLADIEAAVAGYIGIRHTVSTYTSARIDDVLNRPQSDVAVRVYGHRSETILAKAGEVRESLNRVAGLSQIEVVAPTQEPRLRVEVDLEAAGRNGVAPGDVRRAAATLLAGIEVGYLFEDQKVFEVVVWGLPDLRESVSSIGGVPIPTATGDVRLDEVADVSIQPGPVSIQREGVFRFVDVTATVTGRDLGSVLADVNSQVAGISFPMEYRAEVLTASLERQSAISGALVIAAAAAVLVLLLLQAAFGGWRRAIAVYVALPTALVGVALGAIVTGQGLSIGVVAGAIGVLAIALRNALVTVDRYQELERAAEAELEPQLILDGARDRFGAVLASACAIVIAFAPFVVIGGLPGLEILRPLAIVVIGGIATSTLFTLFLLPAVYFRSGSSPEPDAASQLVEQPGMSPA
jgi:Cu/Ag efflux pump CusA